VANAVQHIILTTVHICICTHKRTWGTNTWQVTHNTR